MLLIFPVEQWKGIRHNPFSQGSNNDNNIIIIIIIIDTVVNQARQFNSRQSIQTAYPFISSTTPWFHQYPAHHPSGDVRCLFKPCLSVLPRSDRQGNEKMEGEDAHLANDHHHPFSSYLRPTYPESRPSALSTRSHTSSSTPYTFHCIISTTAQSFRARFSNEEPTLHEA
ncbi:hypothetical protein BO99DRAFT_106842 [Aspergillus violaceofuscus CBS 115571]|uniref:Uncharacterized protein n=1 Tax=Aspergillus violaceofuscus (strain CBS 115571) TaxID=1450538 RepID=A0A2V5HG19_ASPV1|nr:hypothetical protein BO99DRAFT_106842 [Aspergillus violaceofuscus CBS 115571]